MRDFDCNFALYNGIPQKYSTTIVAAEKKIVKLSCLEGIMIEKVPDSLLLNERNEKGRGGIVRISATRTYFLYFAD